MEFTLVILRLLWRHAPVQWLSAIVGHLIDWATAVLENEEHRTWIDEHPSNAQWYGGWLAIIEARLDELIDLRAHKLLGRPWRVRKVPAHRPMQSIRSCSVGYLRLIGIVERFYDIERLARRRAEKLQRLFDRTPCELADNRPVEAAPLIPLLRGLGLCAVLTPALPDQRIRAPP